MTAQSSTKSLLSTRSSGSSSSSSSLSSSSSPSTHTLFASQSPTPGTVWRLLLCVVMLASLASGYKHSWEAPGCHLVGHTRTVTIPDCVPFEVTTNACRGFCVSYAIPSPLHTLAFNRNFIITSRAECCGIVDTHDVKVWVACRDGYQEKTFKSARSCACSICRREQ